MKMIRDVETNSVSLRLRKAYTNANLSTHTVLTDDVFSYVDFYFKTHKRIIKDSNGRPIKQNYLFYWEQSRNFYNAAKILPIESAALPMYYCMLNAVKAYMLYSAKSYEEVKDDLGNHGLSEYFGEDSDSDMLDDIKTYYKQKGVFSSLIKLVDGGFCDNWMFGKDNALSVKTLLAQLPFVHGAYVSTYNVPRKNERFIPLESNTCPMFQYGSDRHIYLVANIDRKYFKTDATSLPEDIKKTVPDSLVINSDNGFQILSANNMRKNEISDHYKELRKHFAYIKSERRLWYLIRKPHAEGIQQCLNPMIVEFALAHRFSEIVRYKPEQLVNILHGKENWLVHEFLSLVLDQFMDEIACEITKQEIMPTRVK